MLAFLQRLYHIWLFANKSDELINVSGNKIQPQFGQEKNVMCSISL